MKNQDWERFGEDIRRTVQDAVDSQDFNRLNQTITNTVNHAMDGLEKGIHTMGDAVGDAVDKTAKNFKNQSWQNSRRQPNGNTYRYQGGPGQGNAGYRWNPDSRQSREQGWQGQRTQDRAANAGVQYRTVQNSPSVQKNTRLFVSTTGTKVGGVILAAAGYTLGISMLLLLILVVVVGITAFDFSSSFRVTACVLGAFLAAGAILAGVGTNLLGKVKRFRGYIREMGGKEYCEIKELSQRLKKNPKYIVKDLEKMINKGWFRQGHLDSQRTCLIVSNEAYAQYTDLMQRIEKQKQEERLEKARRAEEDMNMDPQIKEIIQAGDEYIKKIEKCNDAIPGEEISAKISRIQTLVDRIFDRVEQNPENVPDIRRMMEYYLPTTVKLLEAYEELDAQPVQGANIISSKSEIEKTLDTLNAAFEKLLDSLFQDTAWNVSADISVLNTMLAQEGLTKDDFKK